MKDEGFIFATAQGAGILLGWAVMLANFVSQLSQHCQEEENYVFFFPVGELSL